MSSLPFEEWDDEARAVLPRYLRRPEVYLSGQPDAPPMPKVLGLYAHHIRLGEAWLAFNRTLTKDARLEPRIRELLVLRVAWRTRAEYEWVQHVVIAREVGVTDAEIDAIARGADAAVWSPAERDALAATDQMIDRFRVDDKTWAGLTEHFDTPQLIELMHLVGSYLCLALFFNSVGLGLDPNMDPRSVPALPDRED
jgi:4-carboxymuconolactone decarboxylase